MEGSTEQIIKVDVTAMWQGISDAHDRGEIDKAFYELLWAGIQGNAYRGRVGRRVIEYRSLLEVLAKTEPVHYVQLVDLWKRLGASIASGVSVASEE